jgi:hypothetical protein
VNYQNLTGAVRVEPSAYRVSLLPAADPEVWHWTLEVQAASQTEDLWRIEHVGMFLTSAEDWGYPGEAGKWPLEKALELARKHAPNVWVNRVSAADRYQQRGYGPGKRQ